MTRLATLIAFLACLPSLSNAAVIADYQADFSPTAPAAGWRYLRAIGSVGDPANYAALVWDDSRKWYTSDGNNFPADLVDYSLVTYFGALHPGRGVLQGSSSDGYLVLAYTLQPGQSGDIYVDGSITGVDADGAGGRSNGWDLRFFNGAVESSGALVVPWGDTPESFSAWLGQMDEGDTVYVAIGPNGSDLFDLALIDLRINTSDTPEPASMLLMGTAVLLIAIRRRQIRR